MSNKIQIDVTADVSKAKKDLLSLEKGVDRLQKNSRSKGRGNATSGGTSGGGLNFGGISLDKVSDLQGLTDVKGLLKGGLGRLGGISLGGIGAGTAAVAGIGAVGVGAAVAWYDHAKGLVEQGKDANDTYERLNQTLGRLGKNVAGLTDVSTTVKHIQETAAKGKVPLEDLERTTNMLMLAFKGNQTEVQKWLTIIADMSAGSGEAADTLAELVTRAKQFDTVEFAVFEALNEKGIPVLDKLAEHLGITTEEARKLAEAGKVTGDNFMKAYELAHAVTYAGANMQGGTATVAGAQNAITKYQELQAQAATQGYNAEMLPYLQERAALEEARYKDPYYRLNNEASGNIVGRIEVAFNKIADGAADFGNWVSRLITSDVANTMSNTESINASIGSYGFSMGAESVMYKGSKSDTERLEQALVEAEREHSIWNNEDTLAALEQARKNYNENWESSAVIDGYLQTLKQQLEQELAKVYNDSLDDEAKGNAKQAVTDLQNAIKVCEEAMIAVKQHEAELAEIERKKKAEQEAAAVKEQYARETAKTAAEHAVALGYTGLDALMKDYEKIKGRITGGTGTSADLERIKALQKVVDVAAKETEQQKKLAESRADYDLQAKAAAGDQSAKVQMQMQQEADKLKSLGFTNDEVQTRLEDMRNRLLADANDKQTALQDTLNDRYADTQYQTSGDSSLGGLGYHKWEANAWGASGATYTSFQNPIDQKQLQELEEANTQLKELIAATKGIDTKAYAN